MSYIESPTAESPKQKKERARIPRFQLIGVIVFALLLFVGVGIWAIAGESEDEYWIRIQSDCESSPTVMRAIAEFDAEAVIPYRPAVFGYMQCQIKKGGAVVATVEWRLAAQETKALK